MMSLKIILISLLIVAGNVAIAQKKQAKKEEANSVNPDYPAKDYEARASKKKKSQTTYDARDRYIERMEKNWKQREKTEKNISGERKVDKSKPPYFGHKRLPKIRPVGKRKVCKVCHIKH